MKDCTTGIYSRGQLPVALVVYKFIISHDDCFNHRAFFEPDAYDGRRALDS
jgi:hypothetical protein